MTNQFDVDIKILREGDEIVGIWENRILIKHEDGSAEFFIIHIDENGCPRLDNKTWKITKGDGEIHINKTKVNVKDKKKTASDGPTIITF